MKRTIAVFLSIALVLILVGAGSKRGVGTIHSQRVRAAHGTVTTVVSELVPYNPQTRDVLIQNNHGTATVYVYLSNNYNQCLRYTSGGTTEMVAGNTITGATSAATAKVKKVVLDSGTWAAGTAVGVLMLRTIAGTFEAENLNVGTATNLATIAATNFRCDSAGDYDEAHLSLRFTSGGTTAIAVGDTITGATGGATGRVRAVTVESGSFAAGTAAGELSIDTKTDTFQAENLDVGASLNVATIAADTYTKGMFVVLPGGGTFQMNDIANAISVLGTASNENVAVSTGR